MTERRNDENTSEYQLLVDAAEWSNAALVARAKGVRLDPHILATSHRVAKRVAEALGADHPEPAVWRTN